MVRNRLQPVNSPLPVLTMGANLNANPDIPVTQPHHAWFFFPKAPPRQPRSERAPISAAVHHPGFEIVNRQTAAM